MAAKYVFVTGGNAGIGKAMCKQLAAEDGCHVFMGTRSLERGAQALASILEEAPGSKGKIDVVQCDVKDADSVAAAAEKVKAAIGAQPLYAVVNNAGAGLAHGVPSSAVLDTNLYGPKRVIDSFMPLISTTEGRIVNIGSGLGPSTMSRLSPEIQAVLCNPKVTWEQVHEVAQANLTDNDMFAYGLSKATLISYTMVLAREYPGIVSSIVSPGFIETGMTTGFGAKLKPEQGTVSTRHCLFANLGGSGWMWGSDAKRSPIDESRDPGMPEYTDPTGRGY